MQQSGAPTEEGDGVGGSTDDDEGRGGNVAGGGGNSYSSSAYSTPVGGGGGSSAASSETREVYSSGETPPKKRGGILSKIKGTLGEGIKRGLRVGRARGRGSPGTDFEGGQHDASSECNGCGAAFGGFGKGRYCHLTKASYCSECHLNERFVIAHRVLKRFDLRPYRVCRSAYEALARGYEDPVYSLEKDVGPEAVAKARARGLGKVREARVRAKMMRDYLQSCPNFPSARCTEEERRAAVDIGRNYLVDDPDTFSLRDLVECEGGELLRFINSIIAGWEAHITRVCSLCKEKGHWCEICRSSERLFPFELDKIETCAECKAFFHESCFRRSCVQCARCEMIRRIKKVQREGGQGVGSGGQSTFILNEAYIDTHSSDGESTESCNLEQDEGGLAAPRFLCS